MNAPKNTDYALLSDAELESLLRAGEADESAVLDELLRRHPPREDTLEGAWASFTAHYLPIEGSASIYDEDSPPRQRRFSLRRTAGAAVIAAAAACMLVVQAGGTRGLSTMARWTVDRFSFGDTLTSPTAEGSFLPEAGGEDEALASSSAAPGAAGGEADTDKADTDGSGGAGADKALQPDSGSYDSFAAALEAFGTPELLPTAIPAEFRFQSAEVRTLSAGTNLTVLYENDGGALLQFRYTRSAGGSVNSVVEKDETPVEVYEREGTTYYFVSNLGYESVNWKPDEATECRISGFVDRGTLKAVIDSMYGGAADQTTEH